MNNRIIYQAIFLLTLLSSVLAPSVATADEYWDRKVSLYSVLPINETDIVFLGNSITDGGEFSELFGRNDIKNRGIRSDVIPGVLKRVSLVTDGKPRKIFLLIGINDISHNLSVGELARRYESLVKEIRKKSPQTKLYIQSVMPINNDFKRYKGLFGREKTVKSLNAEIERIASENGARYIDLWPFLADSNGKLKKSYTNDGLHLNGPGYKAWTNGIRRFVED